jgi:hypothetical protein
MVPEELYKRRRRHNNTPKSILLIINNYIVVLISTSLFTSCAKINWFFWVTLVLLGVYNFFNIRRNHEEYDKMTIIAYVISIAGIFLLFFLYRLKGQGC